jgi:hypothetical protein
MLQVITRNGCGNVIEMYRTLVGFTDLKKGKMLPAMVGFGDRECAEPWWGSDY